MQKMLKVLTLFFLLALGLVACNTEPQGGGAKPSIKISLSSSSLDIIQGKSNTIQATVVLKGSQANIVLSVSGLNSKVSLDPNSLALNNGKASLKFNADSQADLGSLDITVIAKAGSLSASTPLKIRVIEASLSKLELSPHELNLAALTNQNTTADISVKNTGTAELNFTATTGATWLSLDKTTAALKPNEQIKLKLTASCTDKPEKRDSFVNFVSAATTAKVSVSINCSKKLASKGQINVTISGLPNGVDADVSLTDSANGSSVVKQSKLFSDLEPGNYGLIAKTVSNGNDTYLASPSSQVVVVVAGETTNANVSYSLQDREKGAINITISGLRSGVAADLVLQGNGKTINISSNKLISNLEVGNYSLKANDITPDSATFAANTKQRNIEVVANHTEELEVNYGCVNVNPPNQAIKAKLQELLSKNSFDCADLETLTQFRLDSIFLSHPVKIALDGLEYATNLKNLSFTLNELEQIPAHFFDNMKSLESIAFTITGFKQNRFPTDMLKNLDKLTVFYFNAKASFDYQDSSDSQLSSLDANMFAHNPAITRINILNNPLLTTIPDGIFRNLPELIVLELKNNGLTAIPQAITDDLKGLQSLSLTGNQISEINSSLVGFNSLLTLSLTHNKLTTISTELSDLTSLLYLDISHNLLSNIDKHAFDSFKDSLFELRLSYNQLTDLRVWSDSSNPIVFPNLETLSLDHNKLSSLRRLHFAGPNLANLYLMDNNIYDITQLWRFTPSSLKLNLSNNCIKTDIVPQVNYIADLASNFIVFTNNPRADCPNSPTVGIVDYWAPDYNSWKIRTSLGTLVNPTRILDIDIESFIITFSTSNLPSLKPWYYRAGEHYYGDASAYAGSNITIDMRRNGGNSRQITGPLLLLKSSDGKIISYYLKGDPPPPAFSRYIINLSNKNDSGVWKTNGRKATNDEIKEVLAKLSEILIRGKFYYDGDSELNIFEIGPTPMH